MAQTRSTSKKTAKLVADFASDIKAENILILDMRKIVNFCDFFVVCSGNTDRHVRAIADGIVEGVEKLGVKVNLKEGSREGTWIVIDLGDIIAHVFTNDLREFYNLEYLWREAKQTKVE